MSFSERLNRWLEEQGKEPWPPEICAALDKAAAECRQELEQNKSKLAGEIRAFMAALQEAERAGRTHDG